MIYELRCYECLPGCAGKLNTLMEELAFRIFEKVGMTVIGAWQPEVGGNPGTLHYMLAYEDMGARERAWEAFWVDPEWVEGRARFAERFGGPIVARMDSIFLKPTAYSPLQ